MSSPFHEYSAKTYIEALEILRQLAAQPYKIIYRGQQRSKWSLQPAFGRIRLVDREKVYGRMLAQFEKECVEHGLLHEDEFRDQLTRETLAQHHGLPTKLLDWTYSPYMALFFAFDGCGTEILPEGDEVAVWCLNWDLFEEGVIKMVEGRNGGHVGKSTRAATLAKYYRRSTSIRLVHHQIIRNERIRRQKGLFTLVKNEREGLDRYIIRHQQMFPPDTLTKIPIFAREQKDALLDFRVMGIDPGSAMADVDGVCKNVFNSQLRFL